MTINDVATYPPYATGFNGLDDDGDWADWASAEFFGWADDDKNDDCPNGAGANNPCWADPGEWGFVGINYNGQDTIFHPWEVLYNENGYPDYQFNEVGQFIKNLHGQYITVGVDEWHETTGVPPINPVININVEIGEFTDNGWEINLSWDEPVYSQPGFYSEDGANYYFISF